MSLKDGRWHVALRNGGSQFYSRCLMEGHLGRHLTSDEIVHHVNEDKTDDRIENLAVVDRVEHVRLHVEKMTEGVRLRRSTTKLTPADIAYVKASRERTSDLARRFGVTDGAISHHRGNTRILKSHGRA